LNGRSDSRYAKEKSPAFRLEAGLKANRDIRGREGIRVMSTFKYHIESDTRLLIAMKLPRRKFLHLAAIPDSLIRLSLQCAALPKEKTAQRGATSHAAPPNRGRLVYFPAQN
jgi:hypothetical protein